MKCKVIIYTFLCMLLFGTLSCKDDLLYDNEQVNKGECVISGSVKFKPFTSALSTRTAGNAIKNINSLCVLLYDEDGKLVNKYPIKDYKVTSPDRTGDKIAEAKTQCATFKLKVPYGTYIIYAVTNMGDLSEHAEEIKEVDNLKNISLQWDEKNVASNGQMFGHFFSEGEPVDNEAAKPLVINKSVMKLQAWVRRAASKVTVAFDGSKLNEGVSITLRALRIKNIPRTCKLGADNTVESKEGLIETGEEVKYEDAPLITMEQPHYPRIEQTGEDGTISWIPDPDRHSETNPNSLFFYENMQDKGPDKQDRKDDNDDGILDGMYPYNEKPYATYIEVDTHYESTNPERPGICNITYRFMLGQDVNTDYNAKRNCHYKLTLHFNGFADEPDWRIDYVTRLGVTQPEVVDYRGKYFVPTANISNHGNTFSGKNSITVNSFMYKNDSWTEREPQKFKIEYRDAGADDFSTTCPKWFSLSSPVHEGNGEYKLDINYSNPYTEIDLNETLEKTSEITPNPYDLSTKGGSTSMNTANCYIVNSKGTYQFPLVYGNAITDGVPNSDSYTYRGWGGEYHNELYLSNFLNYKNNPITSPYILKDIYSGTTVPAGLTASLVWQDEKDLVTNIAYIPDDPGAIKFEVNNPKEGNAVIALKDQEGTVMWSWHIWVTAVDLSRTLILTNNENHGSRKYEIMPVNLGWCSGGIPVWYYDRHECEVKFTQLINKGEESEEGVSQIVKIVQEPHIALPCGNNPYYQHGRKDPFVAGGDGNNTNKPWYDANSSNAKNDPPALMHASSVADNKRTATYRSIADFIRNPNKWQNGPRKPTGLTGENDQKYYPIDTVYFNLWDNSMWDGNDDVIKTIYDPCPAGYHVSSIYTFSGFTDYGASVSGDYSTNTYVVIEGNMLNKSEYKNNIVEFYTDKTKLISIGFPANGYRDWDDNAKVWQYGQGEVWSAQAVPFDWGRMYNAYHLEFTRLTTGFTPHFYPSNNFYATDGMAVRPTRTLP